MLKKLFLALTLVANMIVVPVFAQEEITAEQSAFVKLYPTISGTTKNPNEKLTAVILKQGKTTEDLNNDITGETLNEYISFIGEFSSDSSKNFDITLKTENINDKYNGATVVLTTAHEQQSFVLEESSEIEISNIVYDNDSVTISGFAETENISGFLAAEGKRFADYDSIENVENYKTDAGYFKISIPMSSIGENARNLYLSSTGFADNTADKAIALKNPKKLYVDFTKGTQNADGSMDKPFATIEAARDYLRTNYRETAVIVSIAEGELKLDKTIEFNEQDARSVYNSVTYQGSKNGKTILSGSKELNVSDFTVSEDSRIHENAKGKVLEMNIDGKIGDNLINFTTYESNTWFEEHPEYDYNNTRSRVPLGIFLNGEKQRISRWPNSGYAKAEKVVQMGDSAEAQKDDTGERGIIQVNSKTTPIANWKTADDMYIEGTLSTIWWGEWAKIASIDTQNNTLTLKDRTRYGLATEVKNLQWAAVNLLEELDVSGEWYIDKSQKKLFYYPPHDLTAEDTFEIAAFSDDVIRLTNTSGLNFVNLNIDKINDNLRVDQNLNFNSAIEITGVKNLAVVDCAFTNIGGNAIATNSDAALAENTKNILIDGCSFSNVNKKVARLTAGSKAKLKNSNVVMNNCIVKNVGEYATNFEAVDIDGVRVIISDNKFKNVMGKVIDYQGFEIKLLRNEFDTVCTLYSDFSAVYTGRSWAAGGNVIEGNIFKNVGNVDWENTFNNSCIYFDDAVTGTKVLNNTFIGPGMEIANKNLSAINYGQGPNITIDGNVFVDWYGAVNVTYRQNKSYVECYESLTKEGNDLNAYYARYPELKALAETYIKDSTTWPLVQAENGKWSSVINENFNVTNNVFVKVLDQIKTTEEKGDWKNISALYVPQGDQKTGNESHLSTSTELMSFSDTAFEFAEDTVTISEKVSGYLKYYPITYYVAFYDGDKLVSVTQADKKITSSDKTQEITKVNLPQNSTGMTVKVMRVENTDTLKPLGVSVSKGL